MRRVTLLVEIDVDESAPMRRPEARPLERHLARLTDDALHELRRERGDAEFAGVVHFNVYHLNAGDSACWWPPGA